MMNNLLKQTEVTTADIIETHFGVMNFKLNLKETNKIIKERANLYSRIN